MTSGRPRILVADDDPSVRALVEATLQIHGFEVVLTNDGAQAVARFAELDPPPEAVVLDQRMPGVTGIEAAERILAARPNQVVVLLSAALTDDVVATALNSGVLQCVSKIEITRLPQVLRVLLGH